MTDDFAGDDEFALDLAAELLLDEWGVAEEERAQIRPRARMVARIRLEIGHA